MRGLEPGAHARFVGLLVELALDRAVLAAIVIAQGLVGQVLGVEIDAPVLVEPVARGEVEREAVVLDDVERGIVADAEQAVADVGGGQAQLQPAECLPSVPRSNTFQRPFDRTTASRRPNALKRYSCSIASLRRG